MKRLFYILIAAPLFFAACETTTTPAEENATLTITSGESMEFTHEAGAGEITYTLEGTKQGAKPSVACNAEWISDITVAETITFNISANEGDTRMAPMLITYGNAQQQVIVKQLSPSEAALNAAYFGGEYYGSIYSPGMGNYYLHLSDNGFNEQGMDKPNSKYYCVDLYAPLYEGADGSTIELPVGTYTLSTEADPVMWTMSWGYSGYRETNEAGQSLEPYKYDHATLIVTEEGATFECSIEGVKHKVKFSGKAEIIDARN